MRILQLSDFYPPNRGGMEFVVKTTASRLHERGHDVQVACLPGRGTPGRSVDAGVAIARIQGWQRVATNLYEDRMRPFHPTFPDPGLRRELTKLVQTFRPDVIHAHSWIVHSVLHLGADVPIVLALHDYGVFCAKKTNLRNAETCSRPSYSRCLPCAVDHYGAGKGLPLATGAVSGIRRLDSVSRFLPVSDVVATEAISALELDPARVTVLPSMLPDMDPADGPGASNDTIAAAAQVELPAEFMLFVGTFSRHKGADILIEAYRGLERPLPLVMIGLAGDYQPPTLPGLTVIRDAPREVIMQAWSRASFGVVPSVWGEPAPLVVLEAMSTGTPLIVSEVGGMPSQVEFGRCALLVPPADADALIAALRELSDNDDLRAELGRAAMQRAQTYEAGAVVSRLERIYAEVIDAGR